MAENMKRESDMILKEISEFEHPQKTENIRMLLADGIEVCGKPGDNMNSVLVGPPGCGKTFSYMLPTILCEKECSMIIDDKKGNLFNKTADTLKKRGYLVLKIDYTKFGGNMKYNCFRNVETEEDAMRLADFMIPPQGTKVDRYWENTAKNLFRCLLEIARYEYKDRLNLRNYMNVFNMCGTETGDQYEEDDVDQLIEKHKKKGYWYDSMNEYSKLRSVSSNTWNCTLNTLRSELKRYNSPKLFRITDESTIDFSWIGKRKTAVYVISSDTDASMYPMVQLMYQDMAHELMKYADRSCWNNENRLPIHVRFLVDDFASGVQQIHFENIIANCRSRNISYMLGFQSISQLRALYEEKAYSILDCVNYQIYYSSTNLETNYYMAKLMQRPVREIQQMDDETICLIRRGKAARYCKRVQTLKLPEYIQVKEWEKEKLERQQGKTRAC